MIDNDRPDQSLFHDWCTAQHFGAFFAQQRPFSLNLPPIQVNPTRTLINSPSRIVPVVPAESTGNHPLSCTDQGGEARTLADRTVKNRLFCQRTDTLISLLLPRWSPLVQELVTAAQPRNPRFPAKPTLKEARSTLVTMTCHRWSLACRTSRQDQA